MRFNISRTHFSKLKKNSQVVCSYLCCLLNMIKSVTVPAFNLYTLPTLDYISEMLQQPNKGKQI